MAYTAAKGNERHVVVDGQEEPQYDGIINGTPVFSPDGKRVVYGAIKDDKSRVVLEGQPGPEYKLIYNIGFSPDGKHLVYFANKDNYWFFVVDGLEGPKYTGILFDTQIFRPDGVLEFIAIKQGNLYRVKQRL